MRSSVAGSSRCPTTRTRSIPSWPRPTLTLPTYSQATRSGNDAVAEKTKQPTPEELQAALTKHERKRQLLETQLADTAVKRQAALEAELAKSPGADPYRAGTEPSRLRDQQTKLETNLETIQPVIETLTGQVNLARALREVETVTEATARMRELYAEAEADLRKAGAVFVEGADEGFSRSRTATPRTARRAGRYARRRSRFSSACVSWTRRQLRLGTSWSTRKGLQPAKDVGAFIEALTEIIFDAFNLGFRGGESPAIDAFGRTYQVDAGGKRYGRTLPNLLPDLRGQDRRIGGTGRREVRRQSRSGRLLGDVISNRIGRGTTGFGRTPTREQPRKPVARRRHRPVPEHLPDPEDWRAKQERDFPLSTPKSSPEAAA